ncbi:MAG: hypothetical protein WBQ89_20010 [Candidatus Acidiferrum sp.]
MVGTEIVLYGVLSCGMAQGQSTGGNEQGVSTVRGLVLNQVTKEPIARALVVTGDQEYATMTNDRGEFEFKTLERQGQGNIRGGVAGNGNVMIGMGTMQTQSFNARKPGYLPVGHNSVVRFEVHGQSETTIYLVPEALILGRVTVPGSEGDVRIQCQLYRREMREGQETWSPGETFTTWADGEFRFSELRAGTYKLITHEQIDRDSMVPIPGAQLFGYPPIYYQNTTDFSAASAIVVKAGETAQVNLAVARRNYYPVQIGLGNEPKGMNLVVYPMGHYGPGWSLGFNPAEQAIEGMLPDGNYTVEADALGEVQSTGILNFSVNGKALEGPLLNLIPNASVSINVREEFQSKQSGGSFAMSNGQRVPDIRVSLAPVDDVGGKRRGGRAHVVEGSDDHTMVIENVRPGRYRVNVYSERGYAASIECGGSDVLHQPLVVGLGGGTPPIEVTMRDDGAEVSGTVEEATDAPANAKQAYGDSPVRFVYLVPIEGTPGQNHVAMSRQEGAFSVEQVPPGSYLVLAYEQGPDQELPGDEETMRALESKGKVIHVEAGQKANVKVKMIAGSNGE